MIYLKYIIFLPFDVFMKIIGVLLAPFFSCFVDDNGDLPSALYWFQTPDSNMFGYLGDVGFWQEHQDDTHTWLGRWFVCTKWQWRNTSHGFSVFILGVYDQNKELVTIWESGAGDLKKYFRVVDGAGFDFKGSVKYPFVAYRLRWRFGWKLHQDLRHPAQYVFSISPFMSLSET